MTCCGPPWPPAPARSTSSGPTGATATRRSTSSAAADILGSMIRLVLLRHGESIWNLENRFTGWTDVDLSPQGVEEAHEAARLLAEGGYTFDVAYTSVLKRAIRTLWIVMD